MDTTRAARAFAEQRVDAEQKRFDVGISTSFWSFRRSAICHRPGPTNLPPCSDTTSRWSTSMRSSKRGRRVRRIDADIVDVPGHSIVVNVAGRSDDHDGNAGLDFLTVGPTKAGHYRSSRAGLGT